MDRTILVSCITCSEPIKVSFSRPVHCFDVPTLCCSDECMTKFENELRREEFAL
ncbi:yhs domain [Caudoviricetes sp.]|nr:yhs domain [Caudoviricetes sp.]UOF81013.1 yhs domain [Caudoviricetes sp.]UOF81409.1 yhs domain [Caudoviricetes sp.]